MSRKRRSEGSYVETHAIASHDAESDVQRLIDEASRRLRLSVARRGHIRALVNRAPQRSLLTDLLHGRSLASIANGRYDGHLNAAVRDFDKIMDACSSGISTAGLMRADELERALAIWRERNEREGVTTECPRHGLCEAFVLTEAAQGSLFHPSEQLRCWQCPCFLPVDLAPKGARKRGPKPRYCSPACRQAGYRSRLRRDKPDA